MKKKIILVFALLLGLLFMSNAFSAYQIFKCEELGLNAINNNDGTCSCQLGFHVELSPNGRLKCEKDKNCIDIYGKNAIQNLDGTCGCSSGYTLYIDPNGNGYCMEGKKECKFMYGNYSVYNSTTNTCGCAEGYELSQGTYQAGFQCRSCTTKYGINSYFNKNLGICKCKEGYNLRLGKCYKEENKAYFYLESYDYNNKVLVVSYDNFKAYELQFLNVGNVYETRKYVGEIIEINLRYNTTLDVGDIFTLDSPTEFSGISTKITNVKEIGYNFDTARCQNMYGIHATYIGNNKCSCEAGYRLDTEKKSCERISIKQSSNYYNSNTTSNGIFDMKWLNK